MTDKMKHTKLPWEVIENDVEGYHIGTDELEIAVAFNPIEGDPSHYQSGKEDAAFIVKAVNNHDKLLEALKGIMASISGGKKTCGHDFTCVCAGDAAREAIKQAEK